MKKYSSLVLDKNKVLKTEQVSSFNKNVMELVSNFTALSIFSFSVRTKNHRKMTYKRDLTVTNMNL